MKEIRQSGNGLLFAMLTNIKDYDIVDSNFIITCDHIVNYQDLTKAENKEIINNLLQKIDYNLSFKVKLEEDKTKEIIANNVKLLKQVFGKLIKFIE